MNLDDLGIQAVLVAEVFPHFGNARLYVDNPFGRVKNRDWLLARFDDGAVCRKIGRRVEFNRRRGRGKPSSGGG